MTLSKDRDVGFWHKADIPPNYNQTTFRSADSTWNSGCNVPVYQFALDY
jgi:hypothetical protein